MNAKTVEFEGYIDFGADKESLGRELHYWEVYMFKPRHEKFSAMTPEEAAIWILEDDEDYEDVFDEEIVKNFEQVRAAGFLGDCVYFRSIKTVSESP